MFKSHLRLCVVSVLALLCFGCGHTKTCEVGLISFGNLEGKAIPNNPNGPVLEGSSAPKIGSMPHYYREHPQFLTKTNFICIYGYF